MDLLAQVLLKTYVINISANIDLHEVCLKYNASNNPAFKDQVVIQNFNFILKKTKMLDYLEI